MIKFNFINRVKTLTKDRLDTLLKEYAHDAYWYGEESGDYGAPYPETHEKVLNRIWNALNKED